MLKVGIKGKEERVVEEKWTAKEMGSGTLSVFATPAMIALMEETAWKSIQEELEEGWGSVGISLDVKHLSATPLGMKVFCESEVVEVEGRRVKFVVRVYDEKGLIGEGEHERFIIDNEKFQKKTDEKKEMREERCV